MWSRNLVHLRVLVGFVLFNNLFSVLCFVDSCLSFCTFSFAHCIVCPCSIYGLWWPFSILKLFWKKLRKQFYLAKYIAFYISNNARFTKRWNTKIWRREFLDEGHSRKLKAKQAKEQPSREFCVLSHTKCNTATQLWGMDIFQKERH